jgi:putative membrane protein
VATAADSDPQQAGGRGSDDRGSGDRVEATRRTRLANERTYLAWWRTGLAAFAVSLGAGRLVPAVAGGPQGLYSALGILFGALGIMLIAYGRWRGQEVDDAISEGRFKRADDRFLTIITGLASIGGLMLIVLILVGR